MIVYTINQLVFLNSSSIQYPSKAKAPTLELVSKADQYLACPLHIKKIVRSPKTVVNH